MASHLTAPQQARFLTGSRNLTEIEASSHGGGSVAVVSPFEHSLQINPSAISRQR